MRHLGLVAVLALLTALAGSPSVQAQVLSAPPQWSSDEVRKARSTGEVDALAFDLVRQTTEADGSAKTYSAAVVLTASFDETISGSNHTLDDYTLCRVYAWTDGAPGMTAGSCYAFPAFAAVEIQNRRVLNGMLAEVTASAAHPEGTVPTDIYWAEAELGVQETPTDRLAVSRSAEAVQYRLKDQTVARLNGTAATLSRDEAAWLRRYLSRAGGVHPQIRRDLETSAILPARLEIHLRSPSVQTVTLSISNARRIKTSYALPTGLPSQLRTKLSLGDAPMQRGLRSALAAIDGKSAPPTLQALMTQMQAEAKAGHETAVLMLFFNITQQYGSTLTGPDSGPLIAQLKPLIAAAIDDQEASKFWQASNLAGDARAAGDRKAAADYLANATSLDSLPFGTFRFVTFANLIRSSADSGKWGVDALKKMPSPLVDNYWTHITVYPWAANAYKDAGDAYFEGYDMENAWLAYDLGRAIDPNWKAGVLSGVSDTEQKLRQYQPDFF